MNLTVESVVRVLVIILVAFLLFWIVGLFFGELGLPGVVLTILKLIIGIGALAAIGKTLGLLG